MESEGEWTDNKKLVDLSKVKDGDIRRAIPKGFSYVSVDFGLQKGYAHVIENEHNIKSSFAKVSHFFYFLFNVLKYACIFSKEKITKIIDIIY